MARRATKKKKKPSARELKELEILDALRSLLEEKGWRVTLAGTLPGRGGHCVVRGERRVILKSQLTTAEKVDHFVEALRGEDLEGTFVRPDLRELLGGEASEPPPEPGAEPGSVPELDEAELPVASEPAD